MNSRTKLQELLNNVLGKSLLEQYFGFLPAVDADWDSLPVVERKVLECGLVINSGEGRFIPSIKFEISDNAEITLLFLDVWSFRSCLNVIEMLWKYCSGRIHVPGDGFHDKFREYLIREYPFVFTVFREHSNKNSIGEFYDTFQELVVNGGKPRHYYIKNSVHCVPDGVEFVTYGGECRTLTDLNPGVKFVALRENSETNVYHRDVEIIRFTGDLPLMSDQLILQRNIKSANK